MIITDLLKFCPNCQSKLNKNNNFISCQNCFFYFYHNPCPTNGVIFYNNKKEVLLVKRKYPPKKNYFDIPGGFINLNETLEQSIFREIKEEINIEVNIKKLKYLTSTVDKYLFKKINQITLCFIFIYKISEDEVKNIKANDDVSSYEFFSEKKFPWEKIAFEGVRQAFKLFFSSFKNS